MHLKSEAVFKPLLGISLTVEASFSTLKTTQGEQQIVSCIGSIPELLLEGAARFSICQYDLPQEQWNAIDQTHKKCLFLAQCTHFSTGIASLTKPQKVTHSPKKEVDAWRVLPKMLNHFGWVEYCALYYQELQKKMEGFSYDAVDEYPLEQVIHELGVEVESLYLKEIREELLFLVRKSEGEQRPQELLKTEKEIVKGRLKLEQMLAAHQKHLKKIVERTRPIVGAHPGLEKVMRSGILLSKLLDFHFYDEELKHEEWIEFQATLQLLNVELGVTSILYSVDDWARVLFAHAIRLVALELRSSSLTPQFRARFHDYFQFLLQPFEEVEEITFPSCLF